MELTKEEYERLINGAPVLQPGHDVTSTEYKADFRAFLALLLQYLSRFSVFDLNGDAGGDVVLVAEQCVRRYREEKGTFLHFFHYLFKRYRRQQRLAEEQQTVRGGIHLGKDIGQTIRAIRKYMQGKGIATINREQVRRIAAVIQKPERVVWYAWKADEETRLVSNTVRDENGDETDLFVFLASKDETDRDLVTYDGFHILLDRLEGVYESLQNRNGQRSLIAMWITASLLEEFSDELEDVMPCLVHRSFYRDEVRRIYWEKNRILTKAEMAQMCGVSPQSASRTFRQFREKLRMVCLNGG